MRHSYRKKRHRLPLLGLIFVLAPGGALLGAETDFSCMSWTVRGKTQLTERYKEYDVVLTNRCPGPVYWTMCIERLDPYTHEIVETLSPAGYLEAEKSSRVNLQLRKGPEEMAFRRRFQEMYVNVGYAINDRAQARCVARQCEALRGELRQRIDANMRAWAQAEDSLNARLVSDCPESGWNATDEAETCRAAIREAAAEELTAYAATDAALRSELTTTGPEHCAVQAGDLVEP